MKRISLKITAQTPLAIGQRKPGGSVSEAMDYIPGMVIRGAIATEILKLAPAGPDPEDDFHRLFLDETAAIFRNAYPAVAKVDEDSYAIRDAAINVLPATALSAKTDSGFKPARAGVFDSLIDSFCAREQGLFYEPSDIKGNPVEPLNGFYSHDGQHYYRHAVNKRLLTRVGINRRRATAQDEMLYAIEVMNESQGKQEKVPTVYRGSILIRDNRDDLATQLKEFLQQYCDRMRLGGSASRGLGLVEVEAALEDVDAPVDLLSQRITAFTDTLKERWKWWNVLGQLSSDPLKDRTFFTLDLQSDAILTENWRRTMVMSKAMLSQYLGIDKADLELHMAHSSYDYRSGWNAAWGLPKDMELVTKMGSVFLFSMPEMKEDEYYRQLVNLELYGVGERCSEGFGQVKVCDQFHQVMREEMV